jgi:hypothetical protein
VDKQLPATVDCHSADQKPNMFQFGFIQTGLDPTAVHTTRIVVRGNKNPNSGGTSIRHMAFEHAAGD